MSELILERYLTPNAECMAHTYLGAVAAGPSQEGEQSKCPVTLATRGGARARGGGRNKLRACRAHPTLQSHQFTFSQHSGLAAAGFLPTYMSPEVCEPPSARKAFERQGLSALQNTLGLYHKLLLDKKKKKEEMTRPWGLILLCVKPVFLVLSFKVAPMRL